MGRGGGDFLYGGTGTDTLYGGPGGNSFFVQSPTTTVIENNIDSSDTVYATAGEVREMFSGSNAIVEGDTNGTGFADFEIQLYNALSCRRPTSCSCRCLATVPARAS